MKIKKNDKELIFEDFYNRINTEFSPEIRERKLTFSDSDVILVELLSWLKTFNQDIQIARKELGLSKPIEYPKTPTTQNLTDLIISTVTSESYKILDEKSEELRRKYALTESWGFPIMIAVLTNVLLIPPKESIRVHYPKEYKQKDDKNKPKTLIGLAESLYGTPEYQKQRDALNLIKYPSIYFTHQVSINELKRWINDNRNLIRAIQYDLPRKRLIKRTRINLFWGQVAWLLKKDNIHSWTRMSKAIEKMNNAQNNEYQTPEPTDLEKHYKRFLESLKALDPHR